MTHWGNNLHAGTVAAEGSLFIILIAGCNRDAVYYSIIKLLWLTMILTPPSNTYSTVQTLVQYNTAHCSYSKWETFKGENFHEFCRLRATRKSSLHEI